MRKKKAAKGSSAKSYIPVLLVIGLLAVLSIILFPSSSPTEPPVSDAVPGCSEGQTRPCSAGSCTGIATCLDGIWTGCRWEKICIPGIKAPCIYGGCAYAYKECNECGTGYGECIFECGDGNCTAQD